MKELWRDIKGFEGAYQISNRGRLKSFKFIKLGRILSNKNGKGGYLSVVLQCNGKIRCTRLHRLVAEAFIPNSKNKDEVNHIDGNKQNNYVENLEWVTKSENVLHAIKRNPNIIAGINHYNQSIRPKPIWQFTLDGEFIAKHTNSAEAQKATGVCYRNILQVASQDEYKPGLTRKQAGGFVWKYSKKPKVAI
ncbi:MAG: NUMOD4 motif-containing HNH endonuclease [Candidatus Micrarchaeia archaeon]